MNCAYIAAKSDFNSINNLIDLDPGDFDGYVSNDCYFVLFCSSRRAQMISLADIAIDKYEYQDNIQARQVATLLLKEHYS